MLIAATKRTCLIAVIMTVLGVPPQWLLAETQCGAGGSSVAQHLLLSYQASFLEIMRAQFSEKKAFSGGSQA